MLKKTDQGLEVIEQLHNPFRKTKRIKNQENLKIRTNNIPKN